uniref:Protein arginine N-methyltransferase n=1 Tax=Plectus sambesii TaxID=2011161 RepID=A0A914XMT6_9BILA
MSEVKSSVFKSKVSPVTGQSEWIALDEDYDFHQEVARAGFADMLHDHERNVLYENGLKSVLSEMRRQGKHTHVLDIGTGTGLLAMMAARAGADRVTAVEAFEPMAKVAAEIMKVNRLDDRIRLISKRSTDLESEAMPDKANVIVAEVFDTELIGEGALRTFKEAHERLVQPGTRVVPASARVWIQPVASDLIMRWTRPPSTDRLRPANVCAECCGSAAVHDIQLDQVPLDSFSPIGDPLLAFSFDFENGDGIKYDEVSHVELTVPQDCKANKAEAVLMWWDLDMDGSGREEMRLSMAPSWHLKRPVQWRDHWMQAVYYFPKSLNIVPGEKLTIDCAHDEYSLWFSARRSDKLTVPKNKRCGRSCFLPLLAASNGASHSVIAVEGNQHFRSLLQTYAAENNLNNITIFDDLSRLPDDCQIDVVIGEPFFFASMLQWHDLRFWYAVEQLRGRYSKTFRLLPHSAEMFAMAVTFDDLWKIRAPVNRVMDFDMLPFDRMIEEATAMTDAIVEPQPLWEYPSVATSAPECVARFDLSSAIPESKMSWSNQLRLENPGTNAVAFWMEWNFDEKISGGLVQPCSANKRPVWDKYSRQGVFFLPESHRVDGNLREICVKTLFDPVTGETAFHFEYGQ